MNNIMAVAFGATTLFATSCMQEDAMFNDNSIAPEVIAAFDAAGFNTADIVKYSDENPITGLRTGYMVGGDIFVSEDQVFDLAPSADIPGAEQYRTTNLVSSPRTISVTALQGYGGGYDLNSTTRTATSWACDNYNAINIGLTMAFRTGNTWTDMVVYHGGSGAGGSAGFPSGGNPYGFVNILSGTASYGTNVTEHVVGHEIGHCIGFRHTDYFNRSLSCGSGGNEGSAGVGAIHIPGTPTGATLSRKSFMLSCTDGGNRPFNKDDKTALKYMY